MASQSGDPCGTVPVTPLASLLSISSIYHRSCQRFALKDQSDVSVLSYQGIGPLSPPLQDGIRFFRPPMPASPSARLTARFPPPGVRIRGFQVPLVECIGLGACCRPGSNGPRCPTSQRDIPPPVPFGPSLSTPLACSTSQPLRRFTYVHRADYLTPHPDEVSRRERLSQLVPRMSPTCFGALSRPLFIQAGRFTWRNRWFPFHPGGNNSYKRLLVATVE